MRDFQLPGRSPVMAMGGMCATSHPLATQVAVATLAAGGTAADAALAAAAMLTICEPQMCGLGGDAFALIRPAGSERIVALNGSGPAPAGFSAGALRGAGHATMPIDGAVPVTLPGAVALFERMACDWSRLGLARCLAPAIAHAEAGVPVAPRTAFDWARAAGRLTGRARDLYLSGGRAPRPGEVFRAPHLAEVMRRIAADGAAGFYTGEVADDMARSLAAMGGSHGPEDFAAVTCDESLPVTGHYRDVELVEHPPNGQGATAILMAKILSHFDLAALDPAGAARAHLETEAAKLAYDARDRFIADPAATTRLDHMLSDDTAARLAALIDPERARHDMPVRADAVHRDTVYLTVVDRDRMAVSLIFSIFHSFGAAIASDRYGIIFQNRGAGFTLAPGHPNEAGPGKRPMHTIIPAMLRREGRLIMPFGVMGGPYQPAGHVRVMTNIADFGMDPQQAIDAPRSFPEDSALQIERGYPAPAREALAAMGHRVTTPEAPLGGAQAILIDEESGILIGASDPRKDGCAMGL